MQLDEPIMGNRAHLSSVLVHLKKEKEDSGAISKVNLFPVGLIVIISIQVMRRNALHRDCNRFTLISVSHR